MSAVKAGAAYFAIIFAVGFVLGTIRVLLLVPRFGETVAVVMEGPFILGASWLVCEFVVRRLGVKAELSPRFTMGLVMFVLLMAAEWTLARYGFGRSSADQLRDIASVAGALGLTGQIIAAQFPLMQIHIKTGGTS